MGDVKGHDRETNGKDGMEMRERDSVRAEGGVKRERERKGGKEGGREEGSREVARLSRPGIEFAEDLHFVL